MILAEPRGARAEFLNEVCERLGLEGVEVFAGKVAPKFTRKVAGVITRAVASIPETLDRVANCLGPGGRMLFMKGPDCDAEIAEAGRVARRIASGSSPITPTRSPARRTTAGSSSTSGSEAPSARARGGGVDGRRVRGSDPRGRRARRTRRSSSAATS